MAMTKREIRHKWKMIPYWSKNYNKLSEYAGISKCKFNFSKLIDLFLYLRGDTFIYLQTEIK